MAAINIHYNIHTPVLLKSYRYTDIGENHYYYNDHGNDWYINSLCTKAIVPFLELIQRLNNQKRKRFKVSVSVSGITLELFRLYYPEIIDKMGYLSELGYLEFLAGTYSNSLLNTLDNQTFGAQVEKQMDLIETLFGQKPRFFQSPENLRVDGRMNKLSQLGIQGIMERSGTGQATEFLHGMSVIKTSGMLICKESDFFRKRLSLVIDGKENKADEVKVNSVLSQLVAGVIYQFEINHDYSSLQKAELQNNLLERFAGLVLASPLSQFVTPSDLFQINNLSAECGNVSRTPLVRRRSTNELQQEAFESLARLSSLMSTSGDTKLLRDWEWIQDAEHLNFMSSKYFSTAYANRRFSPYATPYDAFINYMNVISDLYHRLDKNAMSSERFKPFSDN